MTKKVLVSDRLDELGVVRWGTKSNYALDEDSIEVGESYIYRVRAVGTGPRGSGWSDEAEALIPAQRPQRPDIISTVYNNNKIVVSWPLVESESDNSVIGYDLEINGMVIQIPYDENAFGIQIAKDDVWTTTGDSINYTHADLDALDTYTYRVRAFTKDRESYWTDYITETTPAGLLEEPVEVRCAATRYSSIFSWDPIEGATSYEVMVDDERTYKTNGKTYFELYGSDLFEEKNL